MSEGDFFINKKLLKTKVLLMEKVRLEYYLVRENYSDPEEEVSAVVYGVEIHKIRRDEYGKEVIQTKLVSDLAFDRKPVEEFIGILYDNSVMPVSLLDIAIEYMDKGYFDPAGRMMCTA